MTVGEKIVEAYFGPEQAKEVPAVMLANAINEGIREVLEEAARCADAEHKNCDQLCSSKAAGRRIAVKLRTLTRERTGG